MIRKYQTKKITLFFEVLQLLVLFIALFLHIFNPLCCHRRKQKEEKYEDEDNEKQREENLHVNKFVILCETFLQMYHAIFSQLQNYIFNGKMEKSCATTKIFRLKIIKSHDSVRHVCLPSVTLCSRAEKIMKEFKLFFNCVL